jgi:hypothetical protein
VTLAGRHLGLGGSLEGVGSAGGLVAVGLLAEFKFSCKFE